MGDTAARLAIAARRNEVARFTIAIAGIDMTGVNMAMQVRLRPDTPGAPLIALNTVTTTSAEGLKLDSVTVTNGVPTSVIKGRINASTMTDATKVPYAGEIGDNSNFAYAMQWTLGGDAQTRIYGDFIAVSSAFGSDSAPTSRLPSYGGSQSPAGGSSSGSLTFGDQVIGVTLASADLVGIEVVKASTAAAAAAVDAAAAATSAGAADASAVKAKLSEIATDGKIAVYDASRSAVIWPNDPLHGGAYTLDKNLSVLFGIGANGQLYGNSSETKTVWPNDPSYATGATINENSQVLSGSSTSSALSFDGLVAAVLDDGNVWAVGPDANVRLSDPVGSAHDPALRDDVAYWVDGSEYRAMPLAGLASLPSSITKIIMVPMLGQSLAASFSDSGMTALTTVAALRTFMFNGGTVPIQDAKLDAAPTGLASISDTRFASLVPLVEKVRRTTAPNAGYGESMGGGMAAVLSTVRPANEAIVFASFAVGSTTIEQLGPTSLPFRNMIRGIERVAAWCALKGIAFDCPVLSWLQGEGNIANNTTPASYSASLLALQAAFKTAVDGTINVVADRPIVLMQPGSASYYAKANVLAASLLDIALANPTKVRVAGGLYHIPNYATGGVHMTSIGYRKAGEEFGRAIAGIIAGSATGALYVTLVANVGTMLTITTNAATQLVKDTATVADPGQCGLVLRKVSDNTTVPLSGIAVSGTNQITATLAAALTPGAAYQIEAGQNLPTVTPASTIFAGPTTGYRTCFRDSSPDTYAATAGSGTMSRWLAYQTIPFTPS